MSFDNLDGLYTYLSLCDHVQVEFVEGQDDIPMERLNHFWNTAEEWLENFTKITRSLMSPRVNPL